MNQGPIINGFVASERTEHGSETSLWPFLDQNGERSKEFEWRWSCFTDGASSLELGRHCTELVHHNGMGCGWIAVGFKSSPVVFP